MCSERAGLRSFCDSVNDNLASAPLSPRDITKYDVVSTIVERGQWERLKYNTVIVGQCGW